MNTHEQKMREKLVEYRIPEYMHDPVMRYVVDHIQPGDFLTALMSNKLSETFARADEENVAAMNMWVKWFYNWAPSPCWGSPEKVKAWVAMRQPYCSDSGEITKAGVQDK